MLGAGDRSASPRQQTLEAAIDWSYQLLSQAERLLWARLSIFAGGFELDAAQAVCGGIRLEAEAIPGLVGTLVEVGAEATPRSRRRSVPAPRTASAIRPRSPPGRWCESTLRKRHRDWIIGFATGAAGASDGRQVEAFERIRIEPRQRLERPRLLPVRPGGGRGRSRDLPGPVALLGLTGTGHGGPGPLSRVARADPGPIRARGQLLWISSFAAAAQGHRSAALQSGTEALDIGRRIGDPEVVAWALRLLA